MFHRIDRSRPMDMIRSGYGNSIDVLFFIQHFTEVCITLCVRKRFNGFSSGTTKVYITQGNHALLAVTSRQADVTGAFTTRADGCKIQLITGWRKSESAQYMTGNNEKSRCGCTIFEEFAT